jgi:integrase
VTAVASLEVSPTTSARRVLAARPALAAKGTAELLARFPPRPVAQCWPETSIGRAEVLAMASAKSVGPGGSPSDTVRRLLIGLGFLIDWLDAQPGGTWQERWLASGADAAGTDWRALPAGWLERQCKPTNDSHRYVPASMELLIGLGIVRPSIDWLLTGGKGRLLSCRLLRAADAEGFGRLHRTCEQDPAITELSERHIVLRCTLLIAAKGGRIADITVGDVLELLEAEDRWKSDLRSRPALFKVLREMGVFAADVPGWRALRRSGQLSVEEIVDRYPIACRPVCELFVSYLKERQPSVDYGTVVSLCYSLVGCFWADLEDHHPGVDSLRLPPEVASGWKARLRTKKISRKLPGEIAGASAERHNYLDVLRAVRSFYLDLAEWALDDPARWGPWVAPCPVGRHELSARKFVRQRKARIDARTRERLPLLPQLARATDEWRKDAAALLAAGRSALPGEPFAAAGEVLVRSQRIRPRIADNVWAEDPESGKQRLLNREEEHAFWSWAVIEVLRFTGLRVEELLELSHYSLVKYRLPTTGELVPLLQVAPSKTDTERLLVVCPELADVLSEVIRRVRGRDGAVRLVRAWDYHERVWLPPAPLLFQHRVGPEHKEFNVAFVSTLINEALSRAALVGADGQQLRCTAHDFRRMFITDAVMNGLPPHIAKEIVGHHDINVTMGYKAVYPDEALQAHHAFLTRRRALRPSEEYRTPTDEEWEAFFGHFERRKVSIGTCGRAFETPCIHEHACVRCPMLWPDPHQRVRLVEIRDNLHARVAEATREGWLGEVEGLEISLAGANDKLAQLAQRAARAVDESVAVR